jgi:natural product precursor
MKKKIKKLNLSKRTISNLEASEMSKYLGGANTNNQNCQSPTTNCPPFTKKCRPSW